MYLLWSAWLGFCFGFDLCLGFEFGVLLGALVLWVGIMHVLCGLGWMGLVNVFLIVDFLGWVGFIDNAGGCGDFG